MANSEEEAYELYNDYACRVGFSVRKHRQRFKSRTNIILMKQFVCNREGDKDEKAKDEKKYSKLNFRTGCGAFIQFQVYEGVWTATKHEEAHNHDLIPEDQRFLMRSQRDLTKNNVRFLEDLVRSGIPLSSGVKLLKKQAGGSPAVGFTLRDAYNCLAVKKTKWLEGGDSNKLIEIFRKRKECEVDFYYDFELDDDSRLCSFFWRDSQMKRYYELFGDVMVHDTTYRTNKYGLICAPFVGMNHHCQNVMFGCGFLLNEKIESFVWLFSTFLKSMDGKCPITLMTDQSAAMAAAIRDVFPSSRHRLCIWHIGENSKINIRGLRQKDGFLDLFNYLLKCVNTVEEFEFYWNRLMDEYNCRNEKWLQRLYGIREKWCPAFSKDYFSGGILSSQRSESTNHCVSRRLSKSASLCDFYHGFMDVIAEWRSKENYEEFCEKKAVLDMAVANSKLLKHANNVYTFEAYRLFELEYIKFVSLSSVIIHFNEGDYMYQVWCDGVDHFRHTVLYNHHDFSISCSCKMLSEVGIMCCHCLRIFNLHCVQAIPERYILKRWTKDYIQGSIGSALKMKDGISDEIVASSIWRTQMSRKFSYLISGSEVNKNARFYVEEGFKRMRDEVVSEVGTIYFEESEEDCISDAVIKDPIRKKSKGERNVRRKSIVEVKCNQARGRKKEAAASTSRTKKAVHSSMMQKNVDAVANVVASTSSSFEDVLDFLRS